MGDYFTSRILYQRRLRHVYFNENNEEEREKEKRMTRKRKKKGKNQLHVSLTLLSEDVQWYTSSDEVRKIQYYNLR